MALLLIALAAAGALSKPAYGPHLPAAPRPRAADAPCPPPDTRRPDEIVVCARRDNDAERLPLREDRFAEGEVARHPGEIDGAPISARSCTRPGACEPGKSRETFRRILAAIRGEDAD